MANGNGDMPDIKEEGRWRCDICKQSGPCVKGDEKLAVMLHKMHHHPPKGKSKK